MQETAPIAITVSGIRKAFGANRALDGVSLDFAEGLMHGVIGPEGAGKTTMMRVILGLMKASDGSVEFRQGGKPVRFEEIRPNLAYMPQSQSLYPDLSVDEHLEFFKELYSIPDKLYEEKREELLRITRLSEFVARPAGKLSGGMYKKLGLMCALLRSPQALLLDEPTNGVDPISRREFWDLLYRLADRRILILVTTSYMDEAERCARVHLIEKGKVVASGEPKKLLAAEGVESFNELFFAQDGSLVSEAAVEVQELTVRFGDFVAVDQITFSVGAGEIFGFLGANGAGKTTTIRVLCGLLEPSAGQVRVAGQDLSAAGSEMAIKARVGYMSQKFTLYNDLTVEENLDFTAALRKMAPARYRARRKELLDFVAFDRSLKEKVQDLPGGTKQQVSLAASLLHDPEIVFLDEPTAGVSPAARARFWSLIRKVSDSGKTVFVTTHYMDEAEQCGRIALMREGKILALDSPDGLKRSAFEKPVFEFDAKSALSFSEISRLGSDEVFTFFEPYGLHFHASIRSEAEWEKARPRFEAKFNIRKISPSLEDVFIKTVEARKS